MTSFFLPALWLTLAALSAQAAEPLLDARYPFRTDSANETLPWYQLKAGEFPPHHSDHRVGGVLVEVDFIHRSGVFRINRTGEFVNFSLPPFGSVYWLNAEADLRDVPLGTYFLFFLYQDDTGAFSKVATMQDQFTMDAGHGFTCRLEELHLGETGEGTLALTIQSLSKNQPDLGKRELRIDAHTRIWKGTEEIKAAALSPGDELLYSRTGGTSQTVPICTDIWVGAGTHARLTAEQRKRHTTFLKERGLPGWIDRVEGKKLTVTLFSADRDSLKNLLKDEGVDPEQWAKEHRSIQAVVADQQLRSYNPPVDKQGSVVQEVRQVPSDCYGSSGQQWVIEPNLLLEGFRKGHIVRLFVSPSWKINDMPFGEGLYTEVLSETIELSPNQYPFGTDFANAELPWFELRAGQFPPYLSEHRVSGELLRIDPLERTGQFRTDRTGELVNFTMPAYGAARFLNADADLADLPLGTRYTFHLYQDASGAFTQATVIMDEFSYLASNKVSYRLESARLAEGKLIVARQIPPVKNYNGDMVKPPDVGRSELSIDETTRVWKDALPAAPGDLKEGDELLVNLTGRTLTSAGHCTDVWIGGHEVVTEKQRKKFQAASQERGLPAWIESVDGKRLTLSFFSGARTDAPSHFGGGDPKAKTVYVSLAEGQSLKAASVPEAMRVLTRLPEGNTAGTQGCSGVRWQIEPAAALAEGYTAGRVVRVFAEKPLRY